MGNGASRSPARKFKVLDGADREEFRATRPAGVPSKTVESPEPDISRSSSSRSWSQVPRQGPGSQKEVEKDNTTSIVHSVGGSEASTPSVRLARRARTATQNGTAVACHLILISDPGQDLDDEMAYILTNYVVKRGWAELLGVVTTLAPSFDRARLARGTLDTLGLNSVPVGVGTDGGDIRDMHHASTFEEWAYSYMPRIHSEAVAKLEPGRRLLYRLYREARPRSISLCIIASIKDAALFLRDNEEIFVQKTREVIIMGGVNLAFHGVQSPDIQNQVNGVRVLVPDSAHNNLFDKDASSFFYRRCQELGVRLVIVSRWCAYAAKVSRSAYDELALMGSSIGCRLRNAQRNGIEDLWKRACAPSGSPSRHALPDRCDRHWFLKTFCGDLADESRTAGDTVWDIVSGFMQYDSLAVLASIPFVRDAFFAPVEVAGLKGTTHLVVGETEQKHGVANSDGLSSLMRVAFNTGLSLNHKQKEQFVLMLQPRLDCRTDQLLACVMLRALFELGIINCTAIIVCCPRDDWDEGEEVGSRSGDEVQPGIDDAPQLMEDAHERLGRAVKETAEQLRQILKKLGMVYVPVLEGSEDHADDAFDDASFARREGTASATQDLRRRPTFDLRGDEVGHLQQVYLRAPPAGLHLVASGGCLGVVASFVKQFPKMFRERTQVVIVADGAVGLAGKSDGSISRSLFLRAEEAGADNRSSFLETNRFYALAQEQLVPLVVISRNFAQSAQLPRRLFDALAETGGEVGKMLCDVQKETMQRLWRCLNDGTQQPAGQALPDWCSREWFLRTHCPGKSPSSGEDVWECITSFPVHLPLAIFAVIPQVLKRYATGTHIHVRSVDHLVFGASADDSHIMSSVEFSSFLCQCAFMGCRLNTSEFNLLHPPAVPLDRDGRLLWTFDSRVEVLDWILQESPSSRALRDLVAKLEKNVDLV